MDKFEFRVWDCKVNQWAEERFALSNDGVLICFSEDGYVAVDRKRFVPSFYTGVKDKFNVKIYTGSIIRVNDDFVATVFFNERMASFEVTATGNSVGFYYKDNLEALGNVFENIDLLCQ